MNGEEMATIWADLPLNRQKLCDRPKIFKTVPNNFEAYQERNSQQCTDDPPHPAHTRIARSSKASAGTTTLCTNVDKTRNMSSMHERLGDGFHAD
jgi:hypothetical protein